MSLKEQFEPDLNAVWFNPDEFGETHADPLTGKEVPGRRFAIIENGVEKQFVTPCVWDQYEVQKRLIVQQQGIYWCDVMLYIAKSCFRFEPKPEEIIYTWDKLSWGDPGVRPEITTRRGYRVVQVIEAESCYEIALDKLIG